ncbi:MAG: hypothetical protein Q8K65_12090 [Alphaproteobacteria bacterium]|nr:hypothetical protein [Alphaproteobacteria bacterium]
MTRENGNITPAAPEQPATSRFFDFAAATQRVLDSFPRLKSDTVFLNLETPGKVYGHWKARLAAAVSAHALDRQAAQSTAEDSSFAFQPQGILGLRSLVYKPDDNFVETLSVTAARAQAQAFAYHHELGHLVVKDAHGAMPKGKPYPENAADGFATLMHLQENKHDILLPLVNSWARAYRFVASGVPVHMTSTSIEAIVADHVAAEKDIPARGADMAKAAADYAETFAPDDETIDNARYIYGRFRGRGELFPIGEGTQKKLTAFAQTALATEDRFAFQVGLSVFRPLLHPAGVEINGTTIRLDEPLRQEMAQKFEAKAAAFGLQSLITEWQENVDSLCRKAADPRAPTRAGPAKPLKLAIG